MSDALENKAVEILDKSQAAIASFADKLTELTKQYGPDVAHAALSLARVDAINSLVPHIVAAIAFVLLWRWVSAHIAKTKTNRGERYDFTDCNPVVLIGGGMAVFISGLIASVGLFNVWAWVGIFEPKLWLAKRILGL